MEIERWKHKQNIPIWNNRSENVNLIMEIDLVYWKIGINDEAGEWNEYSEFLLQPHHQVLLTLNTRLGCFFLFFADYEEREKMLKCWKLFHNHNQKLLHAHHHYQLPRLILVHSLLHAFLLSPPQLNRPISSRSLSRLHMQVFFIAKHFPIKLFFSIPYYHVIMIDMERDVSRT